MKQPQTKFNESVSLDEVFAFVLLVAAVAASLSGVAYAGRYILTEITRYTTMDLVRIMSAMP